MPAERPRKPPRSGGKPPARGKPTDRARKQSSDRRGAPRRTEQPPAKQPPKKWGGVARRGAGNLGEDEATASRIWRDAVKRARDEPAKPRPDRADDWEPEVWTEDKPSRPAAAKAPAPRKRPPRELAPEVAGELTAARGEK